jgi:pyruvate,water dikinase
MAAEIDRQFSWLCETNEVHLRSSAGSGVMEGVIQGVVSRGQQPPTVEQQAEAARLLSGAEHVESAVLVEQLDEVVDSLAAHPDVVTKFQEAEAPDALAWLCSEESGAAALRFADFLKHHGHRSFRELCLREKAWVDEPEKLVVTMQASVAARMAQSYQPKRAAKIDLDSLGIVLRWLLPRAHRAVRRREHTKSLLVEATHRLKRAYRHLGKVLQMEGRLDDADLVFFFTHRELMDFCENPRAVMTDRAAARRRALGFHEKMEFEDVYVGKPEPLVWQPSDISGTGILVGRPVSRGVVEGPVRVALTLGEAAALRHGEILVAPITDVGWTPYFSMVAGLATDVGSAVSHGAVIAREYGLPAIVNLRTATKEFKTGDRVRLDADRGVLTRID